MALVADWSPEQISGVGDMINCPVSHEWIYRYVARDKANGGTRYTGICVGSQTLSQGVEQQTQCHFSVSIDERPAIVK